jgi:hypothetical protein
VKNGSILCPLLLHFIQVLVVSVFPEKKRTAFVESVFLELYSITPYYFLDFVSSEILSSKQIKNS